MWKMTDVFFPDDRYAMLVCPWLTTLEHWKSLHGILESCCVSCIRSRGKEKISIIEPQRPVGNRDVKGRNVPRTGQRRGGHVWTKSKPPFTVPAVRLLYRGSSQSSSGNQPVIVWENSIKSRSSSPHRKPLSSWLSPTTVPPFPTHLSMQWGTEVLLSRGR